MAIFAVGGLCLALWSNGGGDSLDAGAVDGGNGSWWWIVRLIGGVVFLACFGTLVALLAAMRRPRVAFADDFVHLDLRYGQPIRVPLDVVECFFLGQGPSFVGKGAVGKAEASNVVVRLAERATDWHKREVKSVLGNWCDGYITIRGAWCGPINGPVVEEMNKKLAAVKRARKAAQAVEAS